MRAGRLPDAIKEFVGTPSATTIANVQAVVKEVKARVIDDRMALVGEMRKLLNIDMDKSDVAKAIAASAGPLISEGSAPAKSPRLVNAVRAATVSVSPGSRVVEMR
jgi:hypothetical protein